VVPGVSSKASRLVFYYSIYLFGYNQGQVWPYLQGGVQVFHEVALLPTLLCSLQRYYPNITITWDGRICMFAVLLRFTLSFVYKVYIVFLFKYGIFEIWLYNNLDMFTYLMRIFNYKAFWVFSRELTNQLNCFKKSTCANSRSSANCFSKIIVELQLKPYFNVTYANYEGSRIKSCWRFLAMSQI
jgi:hypothetical protein